MLDDRAYDREGASQVLLAPSITDRSRDDAVRIDTGDVLTDWIEAWMAIGGSLAASVFLRASLLAVIAPIAYTSYKQQEGPSGSGKLMVIARKALKMRS